MTPNYPRWLIRSFAVSLFAILVGFVSLIVFLINEFSVANLVPTFLLPLGLISAYYLIKEAGRYQ
jgi:hypothetical protein